MDIMTEALVKDKEVQFFGFGAFRTRMRKARNGRNPKNGELMLVRSFRTAVFKPGRRLRRILEGTEIFQARTWDTTEPPVAQSPAQGDVPPVDAQSPAQG